MGGIVGGRVGRGGGEDEIVRERLVERFARRLEEESVEKIIMSPEPEEDEKLTERDAGRWNAEGEEGRSKARLSSVSLLPELAA